MYKQLTIFTLPFLPLVKGGSFILTVFTHTQLMPFERSKVSGKAGTVALVSKG